MIVGESNIYAWMLVLFACLLVQKDTASGCCCCRLRA